MTVEVTEVCLFWGGWQIQQWWSCMNKSEWASWVQAGAVTIALLSPLFNKRKEKFTALKIALEFLPQLERKTGHILWHVNFFENEDNFKNINDVLKNIETLQDLDFSSDFVAAMTRYDYHFLSKILVVTNETKNIVNSLKLFANTEFSSMNHEICRQFAYGALRQNLDKLLLLERRLLNINFILNPKNIFGPIGLKHEMIYFFKRLWIFIKM